MRKNTARKWVHLLLDLLPVLIIPIFAIYTINHETTALSVSREEQVQLDFNQLYSSDLHNNYISCADTIVNFNNIDVNYTVDLAQLDLIGGHKYVIRYNPIYPNLVNPQGATNFLWFNSSTFNTGVTYNNNSALVTIVNTGTYNVRIRCNEQALIDTSIYVNIFDLTQMYGVGNEPLLNDFNLTFSNDNYDYTLSEPVYIERGIVEYNNTDIGSQFVYSMYIPVRDYFNMTNLFNFGDIYTWINNSMFSGNAPLPIFIVYNVIVYEFLIDLIFLIYSIFMFIIDFSSELLARCFSFSNKGGTR